MKENWDLVIGLEIHVQLTTASKIFSATSNSFGADPNCQANIVDLGFPGTLPVINEEAIKKAITFGIAVNANIANESIFARKNYFYPDLPKGYQISQYEAPIVANGKLRIHPSEEDSTIIIERAHLEEDAGKSIHFTHQNYTGIDLNRAGTPLLEIVTAPSIKTSKDAIRFLKRLRELVTHLEICDGNMQEGSFRCDANVSVRKSGTTKLGTRAEIKNLNSFKFIESAIEFERARQIALLESGENVIQETRLYDEKTQETRSMRVKENEFDYRYFPDPDLLPVVIDEKVVESIRASLPELPDEKRSRYSKVLNMSAEDTNLLLNSPSTAKYFEDTLSVGLKEPKSSFNWITGELFRLLKKEEVDIAGSKVSATELGLLVLAMEEGSLPKSKGKEILNNMWETGTSAKVLIEKQISESSLAISDLESWLVEVLTENRKQVEEFRSGKEKILGFLVGQVMKKSKGRGDPKLINDELLKKLRAQN